MVDWPDKRQYVEIALKRLGNTTSETGTQKYKSEKTKIQYKLFEKGNKYLIKKGKRIRGQKAINNA